MAGRVAARRGAAVRAAAAGGAAIGIIGGSGLYEVEGLTDVRWRRVRTPFGEPSDAYCVGRFAGRRVIFLPRHGRDHRVLPTELNFRANVWGLKALGAEWVISISAVGSMREAIRPLDLVIPDQFFDATRRRVSSFFGDGIVAHVGMAEPVCPDLATVLEKAARQTGATVHRGGTYLCIEGPQFSTKAESRVYRDWGVDVIGMTNMPEAKLAREAELCYATLALATDYDVWHETHEAVSVEAVVQNLLKNVRTAKDVLRGALPTLTPPRTCACGHLLANVGEDFPEAHLRLLQDRGVDLDGLTTSRGRTFRWAGQYSYDLNEAKTLDTQLNVFADFRPSLGDGLRRAPFVFLANIDPELQLDVLRQMEARPRLVALDTMNFWIQGKQEALRRVLAESDVVTINDAEARQLASEPNLVRAARAIAAIGPRTVVVKRGEYGALMLTDGAFFFVPAYPLESVYDPTGAGDTFAGGVMGYLAAQERTDAAAVPGARAGGGDAPRRAPRRAPPRGADRGAPESPVREEPREPLLLLQGGALRQARAHRRAGRLPCARLRRQHGRPRRPPAGDEGRRDARRPRADDRGRAVEGGDPRAEPRAGPPHLGQAVVRVSVLPLPVRRPDHAREAPPGGRRRGVRSLARLPPVPRPSPRPPRAPGDRARGDGAGVGGGAPRGDRAAPPCDRLRLRDGGSRGIPVGERQPAPLAPPEADGWIGKPSGSCSRTSSRGGSTSTPR